MLERKSVEIVVVVVLEGGGGVLSMSLVFLQPLTMYVESAKSVASTVKPFLMSFKHSLATARGR